jgi:hypothetical protein
VYCFTHKEDVNYRKAAIMNKIARLTMAVLIAATGFLFAGQTANASPGVKDACKEIGHEVRSTDPLYNPAQDIDHDGISCENKPLAGSGAGGSTTNGGSQNPATGSGTGVYGPASPGQVDTNGNPVKLDSNGNPIQLDANGNPIQLDANGNPVSAQPNLANTGINGVLIWIGVALVGFGLGLFYLFRKLRTATN